jgi:hypothetical protein
MPYGKVIHANVSERAHERFTGFCESEGVSASGFLEALATELEVKTEHPNHVVDIAGTVKAARAIDAQRRRRHRG